MHNFRLVEDDRRRTLDLFVFNARQAVYAASFAHQPPAILAARLAALRADVVTAETLAIWHAEDITQRAVLTDPAAVWEMAAMFVECGHVEIVADQSGIYPERFGAAAKAVLGHLVAQEG